MIIHKVQNKKKIWINDQIQCELLSCSPAELIWRCVLAKQLQKVLAILLGCMSASILLAEATILPNGVDLSLFSILINAMKKHEMPVQVTFLYRFLFYFYPLLVYWNRIF